MAIDLGDPIWVTIIANEGAPPDQVIYHNYRFTWPRGVPAPTGPDTIVISGISLYGYARRIEEQWQWVVQVTPDPNVAAIDAIPGQPGGWSDAPARQVYLDTGFYLLQAGVTAAVLRPGLLNLYNAAKAELIAEGWTGP